MSINKNVEEDDWEFLKRIGELYKSLRIEAGLKQREAADLLKTSQARIPPLEHGQTDVMVTTLSRWARAYGYNIEINLTPIEEEGTEDDGDLAQAG